MAIGVENNLYFIYVLDVHASSDVHGSPLEGV